MTYAPAPVVPPSSREPVVRPACTTGVRPSAELNRPQAPLVEPRSGALVLNIGDIVQVWSNDRYRAPLHRVLASRDRDRYSAPFFVNPSHDTVYRPLVSSCSAERPADTGRSSGASSGPAAPRAITQTWARRSRSRTIGFERRVGKPKGGQGTPLPGTSISQRCAAAGCVMPCFKSVSRGLASYVTESRESNLGRHNLDPEGCGFMAPPRSLRSR